MNRVFFGGKIGIVVASGSKMAEHTLEEHMRNVLSRSGRQVYLGDLERRRPTKRMTTVRSFAIVRNWERERDEPLNEVDPNSSLQNPKHSLRYCFTEPENRLTELSHEPLGSQEMGAASENDGSVQIPSVPDGKIEVDVPLLATSSNNKVVVEPSTDTSHGGLAEINDVNSMVVDTSPVKDELPASKSTGSSLPGGDTNVSKTARERMLTTSTSEKQTDNRNIDDEDDSDDENNLNIFHETTPVRRKSPPQNVRLKSGGNNARRRSVAKKKVLIDQKQKENKQRCCNDEEYEAQNFVRLFNADRGRKGGAKDVTDLDIVLTNIEEVALEIRSTTNIAINRKLVRETFIQIRQKFSDTIDVYKEKKYLQCATTKTNSKIKKMKKELLRIQNKRKETCAKLNKLKAQCKATQNQIKGNEEAFDFLTEFEKFQDSLRESDASQSKKDYYGEGSMQSLLCETSGYLSTERQLRKINDDLQLWLNKEPPKRC